MNPARDYIENQKATCRNKWFKDHKATVIKLIDGFAFKQPLTHGWLLPYLLEYDTMTWQRWDHWYSMMQDGDLSKGRPIPRIEWSEGQSPARKHLEHCLNAVTKYGGWQGWSSHTHFEFFLDWLLFGLGDQTQKETPKGSSDHDGASERLYQIFNLGMLLAYPNDYLGDIMAESGFGKHSGFFPTPMQVCEMMVRMQFADDEDMRAKSVCDPALGTGRMLLCASNYSYRLHGMDINNTVLKACRVNGWLYAPWLVRPLPFLATYESAHEDAPMVPTLQLKYQQTELLPA